MNKKPSYIEKIVGWLVVLLFAIGVIAFAVAVVAGLFGEWVVAGTALVAAALAYGLLLNAILS